MLLAVGFVVPVGYTNRYDEPVPLTTVTFNDTATASAGTTAASDNVTLPPRPSVLIGLAGSRVSSTRVGSVATKEVGTVGVAADATHTVPPPNVTATAAPTAAHLVRSSPDVMLLPPTCC